MNTPHKQLPLIGKRLKSYMTTKGIGVNELGRMTNTSGAQIHNICRGRKYGIEYIFRIFEVCPDIDKSYILFGTKK